MKVVEIFESIDGEGIYAGCPATFIRLFGCNLKCSYCDSRYACEGDSYQEMSVEQIVDSAGQLNHKHITLTGGEPLIHKDVTSLIDELAKRDYIVNIETDGAVGLSPFLRDDVVFTMDYKCPSSDMEGRMIVSNLDLLKEKDVLKFVVGSQEDLNRAEQILSEYNLQGKCNIFFSPVFGKIEPEDIVEFILLRHLEGVRVQLQLHKFIWDPNMKGV